MIIYKDIVTGAELFTDSNKLERPEEFGGQIIKVTCRERREEIGNDFDIGANASQEEQGEALESTVKQGVDIVMQQHLEEVTHLYDKPKQCTTSLKCYMKCAGKHIKEKKKDVDQKKFSEGFKNFSDYIKANFDDIQLFTPPRDYDKHCDHEQEEQGAEEAEPEPMLIPLHRDPNTGEITMYFVACACEEEKC